MSGRPAVFLDRDGTINVDHGYVHTPEAFEFLDGAPEAITELNRAGYLVLLVTNQSGVARGLYTEADVQRVHDHMMQQLTQRGARLDAIYYCPDHPQGIGEYRRPSRCRKPDIGMFEAASRDFRLATSQSWMVGDKLSDIHFGLNAGLRPILVLSGQHEGDVDSTAHLELGSEPGSQPRREDVAPSSGYDVRRDLTEAVALILSSRNRSADGPT